MKELWGTCTFTIWISNRFKSIIPRTGTGQGQEGVDLGCLMYICIFWLYTSQCTELSIDLMDCKMIFYALESNIMVFIKDMSSLDRTINGRLTCQTSFNQPSLLVSTSIHHPLTIFHCLNRSFQSHQHSSVVLKILLSVLNVLK